MSIHSQHTPNSTRHVGTCGDKRVAIIIQDPQATHEVHVVDTDSLPDAYHQNLMDLLMRPEAQASKWLGEYLHRQMLFDGTNALRQLYERKWIHQVPITSVYLTPRPNQRVALTEALGISVDPLAASQDPFGARDQEYDNIVAQEQNKLNNFNPSAPDRHNQHVTNLKGDVSENNRLVAANLIAEAKMLETDAAAKRNLAAQYDPNTKTQAKSAVSPSQNGFNPLAKGTNVPVNDKSFVDSATGKSYSTASALKSAVTRREKAAKNAGNG